MPDPWESVTGFGKTEQERQALLERLRSGGGGGTSDGVTDDWKASVDRQLEQLHGDVRNLLFALIGGFLLLAGGGWVVYDKLSDRIVGVDTRMNALALQEIERVNSLIVEQAKTNAKLDILIERTSPTK